MGKKAILLTNLGSPESTDVADVRRYLRQFLMDERVIDVPGWLRTFLVKGIIVPFRGPKSAKMYESIWTDEGSPLIVITEQLTELVGERLKLPTYMCMRYAQPSAEHVLQRIIQEQKDLEELILVPLYPHYAMSSYETAVVHVQEEMAKLNPTFKLKVVKPFYDHPSYIHALSQSIKPLLEKDYDHVLFSYHGIPERHVRKSDPTDQHCLKCENCCQVESEAHKYCYRHQIIETTEAVAKELHIPSDKYSFSFQSRLGSDKWLSPYTTNVLKEMPKKGIKNLVVACPAFVSDCLETLEEICEEGEEDFLEAGGESFHVAPCLNTDALWVDALETMILDESCHL